VECNAIRTRSGKIIELDPVSSQTVLYAAFHDTDVTAAVEFGLGMRNCFWHIFCMTWWTKSVASLDVVNMAKIYQSEVGERVDTTVAIHTCMHQLKSVLDLQFF
jgi:hypothetical protein